MFYVLAVRGVIWHGTLYIQRGVASGARFKRFTLCRKYISRRIFTIIGVSLIIMDFGRIKNSYCGHHETVNSTLNSVMVRRKFNLSVTEMTCNFVDVLSPSDKIDANNELCFATRSESIDFH